MSLRNSILIALRALRRNKLQTALTMIGITIGVATVLTMIALGSGAQAAIEDQVRAAGMNLIVVTAGNYKTKTQDHAVRWKSRRVRANCRSVSRCAGLLAARLLFMPVFHPEDDPMEKHDHPTASQRLGDQRSRIGRGGDADVGRRRRDPQDQRRAVCFRRDPRECACRARRSSAGSRACMATMFRCRRSAGHGRFHTAGFSASANKSNAEQVIVLGCDGEPASYSATRIPSGKTVSIWKQPFKVVGVVGSGSWLVAPDAGRRSVRRRLCSVHHHPAAAESIQAERHHHHHRFHRRRDPRREGRSRICCACGTRSAFKIRMISPSPARLARRWRGAGCVRKWREPWSATSRAWKR